MFRVEFFVDDKRLGAALLALVGIAHGQPGVVPVVNAAKKGNGIDAVVKSGSSVERFATALKPMKGKTIVAGDIRPIMKTLGMQPSSRGYLTKQAVKAHLLKKSGSGSSSKYLVL
jgi:hypothetical protein